MINALPPAILIEDFSVSHWMGLTLRPITEMAAYETSLGRIAGIDYEAVSAYAKTLLNLAGLIEVLWIGLWALAFSRSIRR